MLRQANNLSQFFYMAQFGPINIEAITVYNDVEVGMAITAAEMDAETKLMVTLIGLEAQHAWHDYAPLGETGNLRSSFRASLESTPLRESGTGLFLAGQGYESVAKIRDDLHFRDRPSQPNETDKPSLYALAIDQGREEMDATFGTSRRGKKRFAWTGPAGNVSFSRYTGKLTTKSGKNTIAKKLRARPGTDFIGAVHFRTGSFADEKVHTWMSRRGRLTPDQLASIRQKYGIFSGNPFERFGNRTIRPPF